MYMLMITAITSVCISDLNAKAVNENHDIYKGNLQNYHKYNHESSGNVEVSKNKDNLPHTEPFNVILILNPYSDDKLNIRNKESTSRKFAYIVKFFKYLLKRKPSMPVKPKQPQPPKRPKPPAHKSTRPSKQKPTKSTYKPRSSRKTTRRADDENPDEGNSETREEYDQENTIGAVEY